MMRYAVLWISMTTSFVVNVMGATCPVGYGDVLKSNIVKTDPEQFFKGTFIDVIVSPDSDRTACTAITHTATGGKITSVTKEQEPGGTLSDVCTETHKKVETGIYDTEGQQNSQTYQGRIYIFYADENALGYYFCQDLDSLQAMFGGVSTAYSAAISVKKEKVAGAKSGSDQAAKRSLDNAETALKNLISQMSTGNSDQPASAYYKVEGKRVLADTLIKC